MVREKKTGKSFIRNVDIYEYKKLEFMSMRQPSQDKKETKQIWHQYAVLSNIYIYIINVFTICQALNNHESRNGRNGTIRFNGAFTLVQVM